MTSRSLTLVSYLPSRTVDSYAALSFGVTSGIGLARIEGRWFRFGSKAIPASAGTRLFVSAKNLFVDAIYIPGKRRPTLAE